jgi:HEAT repeat protein
MRRESYPLLGLAVLAGVLLGGCAPKKPEILIDPNRACIDAQAVLQQAAEDKDPATRAHAVEAIAEASGARAGGVLRQALSDPNPVVRFAAAMAIGDMRYAPAKADLLRMAQYKTDGAERDKTVYCATIYALFRLGETSHATPLGRLLFDDEREIRANVALIMGRMREPSAIGPLKSLLTDEQDVGVQLLIVEALALLGDQRNARIMEAYTKTQYEDERLVAIRAMPEIASTQTAVVLWGLAARHEPPRVRIAAAEALGRMGETAPALTRLCVRAAEAPEAVLADAAKRGEEIPITWVTSLQQLAAIALGRIGEPTAVNTLHPLLRHEDGAVRVAAAMSILRLFPGAGVAPPKAAPKTATRAEAETGEKPAPTPKRPKLQHAGGKD